MYDTILAKSPAIIYQPGGVTQGVTVTTWAEVQTFISLREGTVLVYVDDSITSPAPVPTASGVTNCEGRVELRSAKNDSLASAVLLIQDGATLRDLVMIRGVEVQCDTQGATPALDFTSVDGGNLLIKDFGALSNATTATQPAITIAAAITLFLNMEEGALILNAPAVPLFSIAATGLLQMWALDATDLSGANPGFAAGAGNVELNYDNASATFFGAVGFPVPPPLPGLTGTYTKTNVDNVWQQFAIDAVTFGAPAVGDAPSFDGTKWIASPLTTQTFLAGATNIFAVGPTTGTRLVNFRGCGGGGAGGGGSGGTLAGGSGDGGGGGGASMYGDFQVLVDFSHRIDVVIPAALPTPGTGGNAIGVDGTDGQDGGTCYVLDFTTNTILCAFAGGSGGQGGKAVDIPGLGGANFPSGQLAGNLTTGSAGFVAAGGNGGSTSAPVNPSPGNQNLTTFGLTPPGPAPNLYTPGAAGTNGAAGQGGGGGGGGQGPFGSGGAGGDGNAGTGTVGANAPANSGAGAGGGAGGAAGSAGSDGGVGSIGQISYAYRP